MVLGIVVFPALAPAQTPQTIKKADVIGAWQADVELEGKEGKSRAWLVLWPDGLWWYTGQFMVHAHGGARWRLVGDTLWLSNDYEPYFHPMIDKRIVAIKAKKYGLAVMDTAVIRSRPPFPMPDSVFWSKAFIDSTSRGCASHAIDSSVCGMWVYKVSVSDRRVHLTRIEGLSRATQTVATKAVLTRDSLVNCNPISGCP